MQERDWVMKGGTDFWNYFWSGKWQPGLGNEFAPKSSGQSFRVPAESIKWSSGGVVDGWIKGILEQRKYLP